MNITREDILQRREEALLDMRIRSLARAGKPVTAAYRLPIPAKMRVNQFVQQWN